MTSSSEWHGQRTLWALCGDEEDLNQIAIDGKALRRSHDRRRGLGPLWLVSAWSVDRGISLGQIATDEKSNEITAILELLANVEIDDAVITIDAAGCQRKIAMIIVDGKGGYVLSLEVRYCISSIPLNAKRFARFVRGHWAIESTLH